MYVLLILRMLLHSSAIRGLYTKSGSSQPLSRLEKEALM